MSVPTLLLSCVHITGDPGILDGPHQPHGLMVNEEHGFMSPEEQSRARAFALGVIKDYRERGCPPPARSRRRAAADDELGRLRTRRPVVSARGAGRDRLRHSRYSDAVAATIAEQRTDFPVLYRLRRVGAVGGDPTRAGRYPVRGVEKNPGLGGTWFENSYPGARVDSPNHLYAYSFEPIDHWTTTSPRSPS